MKINFCIVSFFFFIFIKVREMVNQYFFIIEYYFYDDVSCKTCITTILITHSFPDGHFAGFCVLATTFSVFLSPISGGSYSNRSNSFF
jgi:hypothetical protein